MRYGELVRKLRRLGMVLDEQGSRHEVWVNPKTNKETFIPRHRGREIPTGTLAKILKDLGISRDEFEKA